MATRQRTRSPAKTTSGPALSGDQLGANSTEQRTRDSQVLRSAFDTSEFEADESATADTQVPEVKFSGEQLSYKDRYERIAEAAYLRAEQRGFEPGHELEDWLAAEQQIDGSDSAGRGLNT